MEAIILIPLIIQWIILLMWIFEEFILDEKYPTFLQAICMLFIPYGIVIMLLMFLYKNDKERRDK